MRDKLKCFLSMCIAVALAFCAMVSVVKDNSSPKQVSAAATEDGVKSVTAVTLTNVKKVKKVTTGEYKVNVKKITSKQKLTTQRQVQFKATKAGTYRFIVSTPEAANLSYPIVSIQLKNATGKTPKVVKLTTGAGSFQKLKVYNKLYEDAYYNYLIGYKEDSQQEVDENECWESMVSDMEKRLEDGVCSQFFVDLELKKGDIIFVCSDSIGEYSYKGNVYQVRDAYSYDLTIKKV